MKKELSIEKNHLTPIFKWTGGKRREIKEFGKFFPEIIEKKYTYIEPFVGGGAVYYYLNNSNGKNVINDFDELVINFYKEFLNKDEKFISELKRIGEITAHNLLEAEYYRLRNQDRNNGLEKLSNVDRAIRFFVVNQLAFSGMRRFNSNGEFNVPFGHYKKINCDIINSLQHYNLLNQTEFFVGDFEPIMKNNDNKDTFMFLDPPYTRIFKEYSSGNSFEEKDHKRLAKTIKSIKNAHVMMIIDKSDFTENLYKKMIKSIYSLKYGVNIKSRFDTSVEHLVVCNY